MLGAACAQMAFNLGNALGAYLGGLPINAGYGYQYNALAVFVALQEHRFHGYVKTR
jgi:DHA1 family arabinose polymer transporter-like MFS transporter